MILPEYYNPTKDRSPKDTLQKIGSSFADDFNRLREFATRSKNIVLLTTLAVALIALVGCNNGPIPVYDNPFDLSLVGEMVPRCVIPEDATREVLDNFTPNTGGKTWYQLTTPKCSGWGLRK